MNKIIAFTTAVVTRAEILIPEAIEKDCMITNPLIFGARETMGASGNY
jgi:hypothetical protein